MNSILAAATALGMLGAGGIEYYGSSPVKYKRDPELDKEALTRAELKRERKNQKRLKDAGSI